MTAATPTEVAVMSETGPHVKAALGIELDLLRHGVYRLNEKELRLFGTVVWFLNSSMYSRRELKEYFEDESL